MNIIVVGDGKVGRAIVSHISKENHNIVVIDKNPDNIQAVVNQFDVLGIVGNGVSYDILKEASVHTADLFIAATSSDEINLLACALAKTLGAIDTIARVRDPEYLNQVAFMRRELGVTMTINPEYSTAHEILNMIQIPAALKIETFANGRAEMMEVYVEDKSPLAGISLIHLRQKYPLPFLVCAVQRGEEVFIPSGDFVIQANDKIHITSSRKNLTQLFKELGIFKRRLNNIMIIGGGKIGHYLCELLLQNNYNVKIIEKDKKRCEELSDFFPRAVIINADGTDQDVLNHEGFKEADAVVALTNIDEENIVISMYAQKQGLKKVIAKVNHSGLLQIIETVDIASTISPKDVVADEILSYVRAKSNIHGNNVKTLYKLVNGQVEAIEFEVCEMPQKLDLPLKDLTLKDNILIAAIIRNNEVIIPGGNDQIKLDDRVVVVSSQYYFDDLSEIVK